MRRAEGRLGDLFVRLLSSEDLREARDAANLLRSAHASPEVQRAVVDAWRRHRASGAEPGLWFHILGQVKPHGGPILDAVFETLRDVPMAASSASLLTEWMSRKRFDVDGPRVADLSAELLATAADRHVQNAALDLLEAHGSSRHAADLERLADNPLVVGQVRERARALAQALRHRR
jgi:hypothetical protein